jgi:hypothetical protein
MYRVLYADERGGPGKISATGGCLNVPDPDLSVHRAPPVPPVEPPETA